MKLAIVDLGYGNIGSIEIAFERLGRRARWSPPIPSEIASADRVSCPASAPPATRWSGSTRSACATR